MLMSVTFWTKRVVLGMLLAMLGALLALLFAGPVLSQSVDRVEVLDARLTGAAEVPGPGDRNGTGEAKVVVTPRRVCYVLRAENVSRPLAAHIHVAPRGEPGPIVVELNTPDRGNRLAGFFSRGCERISPALSRQLRLNPARYYVNVHNAPFPDGAIRGQLTQ